MAVAAQEDFGFGAVGAGRAQEAAEKRANRLAAGRSGRAKNGGRGAVLAVEHRDRVEAVFV